MIVQKLTPGRTSKSVAHQSLLRLTATSMLIAQLLAATLTSGQQVTSSRQAVVGGTKQATNKINNNANQLLNGDQLTAPFYSIKDGKTSARRIQQQQQQQQQQPLSSGGINEQVEFSSAGNANLNQQQAATEAGNWIPSTTVPSTASATVALGANGNNRDEFPEIPAQSSGGSLANANGFNEDNVKRLVGDRRAQQQQQVALNAGSDAAADQQATVDSVGQQTSGGSSSSSSGNDTIAQQRLLINSFNQLVGADGALDDFLSSTTTTTTAQPSAASNRKSEDSSNSLGDTRNDQQRINSFTTTTTTTTPASTSSDFDSTFRPAAIGGKSGANRASARQQQQQQPVVQFTTATGAPLSTPPSSLSMSLDGMIVNSRPRSSTSSSSALAPTTLASASATGEPVSFERQTGTNNNNSGKRKQQQPAGAKSARMGELSLAGGNNYNSFNGAGTKVSRRVPFTGIPFSSPASKGQRNKPNQQQQQVFNANQQAGLSNGIFGPQATDLMAGMQQFDSSMMANAARRPSMETNVNEGSFRQQQQQQQARAPKPLIEQLNMGNFVQQEQQLDSNLLQGFDDEQQQQQQQQQRPSRLNVLQSQQQNGDTSTIDGSTLELMKNLINSPALRDQVDGAGMRVSNSSVSSPNDMVMSVMSSVDGKERRLVMIARNTLEGLQKYAQNQQQQLENGNMATFGATKGQEVGNKQQVNRRPMQQQQQQQQQVDTFNGGSQDSNLVSTGPSNNWWPNSGQTGTWSQTGASVQQSNVPTTSAPFRSSQQSDQQQQQQEVQLQTTTSAPINLFSSTASVTTISPQVSTNSVAQSPDFGQSKIDTQTELSRKNDLVNNSSGGSSMRADLGGEDSFREVPVSTLVESSAGIAATDGAQQQQQQQQLPARSQSFGGSGNQKQTTSANQSGSGVKSKASGKQSSSARASGKQSENNGTSNSGLKSSSKQQQQQRQKQTSPSGGSQQRNKSSSSSGTKSGKRKNNGGSSSGSNNKQTSNNGGGKQTQKADQTKSTTTTTTTSSGRKTPSSGNQSSRQLQQASGQQSVGSVKVTNGQQQPAAMRLLVEQQQQQSNGGGDSTPSKRPSGGVGREELSTPSQSSGAFGSNGNNNDQVDTDQQQTTTTTSPSVPANKRLQQGSQKTTSSIAKPTGDDERQEQQWSSQSPPVTQMPATGTRLAASGDKGRLAEAEFGRGGASSSSSAAASSGAAQGTDDEAAGFRGFQNEMSSLDELRAAIPGEPQVDYPIYSAPPKTSFDCMSQSCPGGYYADLETQCQVFHICQNDGRFDTFLCPNGTIFSQQHFVCVWWWQVDCQQSASFYKLNDGIYCNSMFSTSAGAGLSLNANSADTMARSNRTVAQLASNNPNKLTFAAGSGNDLSSNMDVMMAGVASPSNDNTLQTNIGQSGTDSAFGGSPSTSSSSSSSSSSSPSSSSPSSSTSSSLGGLNGEITPADKTQSGSQITNGNVGNDNGNMKQQIGETQPDDADLSQQHIERLVKKA